MKSTYWRGHFVSRWALLLVAVLAAAGMAGVEIWINRQPQPLQAEKLDAARRARQCMRVIREERIRLGHDLNPQHDPTGSGMVGATITPVTSTGGHLGSKQATSNPNFAAVVVDMLHRAGIKRGDRVAIGYSGSFPAMNVCVCSAVEAMGVKPLIIASATASQYGANCPDLMWLDMERLLNDRGCISFRALATSIGGYEDQGLGLSEQGRQAVLENIRRSGVPMLKTASYHESVRERMDIYAKAAEGNPIKAYINIGGGTASVGRSLGKKLFNPGLNLEASPAALGINCVMTQFIKQGVPVIHLVQIFEIARKHGLPVQPKAAPTLGAGQLYLHRSYKRWFAGSVLAVVLAGLWLFILRKVPRGLDTYPVVDEVK